MNDADGETKRTDQKWWGVRWCEKGDSIKVTVFDDESEAKNFYEFLVGRYKEQDREDHPELVSSQVNWRVQKPES